MNIAIFTVIKDELDYLDDFLKYHTQMGIDIFVFEDVFSHSHLSITEKYDNVYLHSIMELYSEEEIDELIRKREEKIPCQTEFINKGLKYIHSLNTYDWCWLIDVDEYITSSEPLEAILSRFKDYEAILVYWRNYGASERLYKPIYDRPIWELYTEPCKYEQYSDLKYYKITKFCVNMKKWKSQHKYFIHNAPRNWVKADGTYKRTEIVYEPLYLRHYITKSAEEYCWKVWVRGMHHNGHRCWKSLREMDNDIYIKLKSDKNFFPYFKEKYGVELPPLD
ncbi:MAG: hypothetical protein J6S67_13605 [Methanobrevibacter sp.]|nr:hypothetical protein [Methanobrevibacter sp.]